MARSIPASEFKAKCLALLDDVAATRSVVFRASIGGDTDELPPAASDPAG